nr:cytochrome P450 [Mycolicibacterium komanii]
MSSLFTTAGAVRDSSTMIARGVLRDLRRAPARGADPAVARTDFDPTAPEAIADPYTRLAELRRHRVTVNERLNVWMLARHDDVVAAARAHDVLSSSSGILLRSAPLPGVVSTDEPDHTRLRRVTAPAFTPAGVRRLQAALEQFVEPGVRAIASGDPVDVVPTLTRPLPISAIALLLGIAESHWGDFTRYSDDFTAMFAARSLQEIAGSTTRALPGMLAVRRLILAELGRRGPGDDDVLGRVKAALDDGDMSMFEALIAAIILLVAGSETTTNLLGILLMQLARTPALYERLRAQRDLIPAAIEEALRWGSPVQWVARTTLAPYPVGGVTIPAHARVVLFYAGANRDPERFDDPDDFDIDRGAVRHLTFGHGAHYCMGAHLARLEAQVVLNQMFDAVTHLEVAGPVLWTTTPSLSGPRSVPVRKRIGAA